LILQCWGSKHSDPASVAFASFWSPNYEDQTITSTRSWDQKWPARPFDPPMLGIKTFWSRRCGLCVILIPNLRDPSIRSTRPCDQNWLARHFDPPMLGIKTFWSRSCGLRVIFIPELWGSNHYIHDKDWSGSHDCPAVSFQTSSHIVKIHIA
jgi:hypothetical protein